MSIYIVIEVGYEIDGYDEDYSPMYAPYSIVQPLFFDTEDEAKEWAKERYTRSQDYEIKGLSKYDKEHGNEQP